MRCGAISRTATSAPASLNGRELSYIEGWHAIAEANRIFGHDGWNRETVETKCVLSREIRGTFQAVYIAKVRITVRSADPVVREGHGTGEAKGASPGEVHDIALKAAETDATKRALATFGKPFGLALYLNATKPRLPAVQTNGQSCRASAGRPLTTMWLRPARSNRGRRSMGTRLPNRRADRLGSNGLWAQFQPRKSCAGNACRALRSGAVTANI